MVHFRWNTVTDNILCEQDDAGHLLATYTQEPGLYGELISQRRDGETSYYHFDGQGSTRQLTNQGQSVTDEYTYLPFGEEVAETGETENPFRWIGEIGYFRDVILKTYYTRARTYSPSTSRWLSIDPIRARSYRPSIGSWLSVGPTRGVTEWLSTYRYVGNNPITRRDPSGAIDILNPECADINSQALAAITLAFVNHLPTECWPFYAPPVPGNPYQHCVWSCRMAAFLGDILADQCGNAKEAVDNLICDYANSISDDCWDALLPPIRANLADFCCSASQPSDFSDNATGRACGKLLCFSKIGAYLLCNTCCRKAGIGPNTPEGPGTDRRYGDRCTGRNLLAVLSDK